MKNTLGIKLFGTGVFLLIINFVIRFLPNDNIQPFLSTPLFFLGIFFVFCGVVKIIAEKSSSNNILSKKIPPIITILFVIASIALAYWLFFDYMGFSDVN